LDADDVLAFADADEAIYWVMQVFAGPGDHVIVTVPNDQAIESVQFAAGAEVTGVLLDAADGWRSTWTPSARRSGRPPG
jgi:aspartate/methionine/tyrosine aminotransferase